MLVQPKTAYIWKDLVVQCWGNEHRIIAHAGGDKAGVCFLFVFWLKTSLFFLGQYACYTCPILLSNILHGKRDMKVFLFGVNCTPISLILRRQLCYFSKNAKLEQAHVHSFFFLIMQHRLLKRGACGYTKGPLDHSCTV